MSKVFIGGSRAISHLSTEFRERLDTIVDKGFAVLVGDANGADKTVQAYFHSKHYPHVEVFCSEGACRNNIGAWPIRNVAADTRERNAEFYSAKDRVMADEADFGLMLWDGKSAGTMMNVFRLLALQKKAVVYIVPQERFQKFKSQAEWEIFMTGCSTALRNKVEQRTTLESPARRHAAQASFSFSV
jgi:hypothetical protein